MAAATARSSAWESSVLPSPLAPNCVLTLYVTGGLGRARPSAGGGEAGFWAHGAHTCCGAGVCVQPLPVHGRTSIARQAPVLPSTLGQPGLSKGGAQRHRRRDGGEACLASRGKVGQCSISDRRACMHSRAHALRQQQRSPQKQPPGSFSRSHPIWRLGRGLAIPSPCSRTQSALHGC